MLHREPVSALGATGEQHGHPVHERQVAAARELGEAGIVLRQVNRMQIVGSDDEAAARLDRVVEGGDQARGR
ncbi:hypothetical protein GCM10025876_14110 [Demequina litorisediminis]|uniref:Uncharacterized protein n=1 Tax=Demequina litorisediminis TaxID=1849022 RepID=A0ABQ6IDG2_9MICO|nr:hypothetical protein GCM10025876_14110 [Demequina litorisediminis]